jgi:hypothetical protein
VKRLLSVEETLDELDHVVSRSSFYAALKNGDGPVTRKLGRRVFVVLDGPGGLREWAGMTTDNGASSNGATTNDDDR